MFAVALGWAGLDPALAAQARKPGLAESADARTLEAIFSQERAAVPSPKALDFDVLSVSVHLTTKLAESTGLYDAEGVAVRPMGGGLYRLELRVSKEFPQDILYMEPAEAFKRTIIIPFWYGGGDRAVFLLDDAKFAVAMGPKDSQAVVRSGPSSFAARRTTYDQVIELQGSVTKMVLKIHYR